MRLLKKSETVAAYKTLKTSRPGSITPLDTGRTTQSVARIRAYRLNNF